MTEKRGVPAQESAELVAIDALAWLAGEPDAFARFLALSGLGPGDVRRAAASTGFMGGLLDFLLGEEKLLVAFAGAHGLKPESIALARRALGRP